MRFLLVNPPYAATEPPMIPMGLQYVGAALEHNGHDVRVLDLLVGRSDRETVVRAVEAFDPHMVGTTSVTMNWPDASRILRWIKEAAPDIKTVAGGPHATFTWQDIGAGEPWVDYVVLGEGERTAVELAETVGKNGAVAGMPGLAWRENGVMRAGPKREFEKDIASLPKPARHLFPLSRYKALGASAGVTTGRGCPFSCIFCVGSKMVGRKPRLMPAASVVDEIEEVAGLGFSHIAFSDDHFGMKRSHALAVCDEIVARGLDISLNIFIRADAADPELLDMMRRAGCSRILYGAESGVQAIVDRIKKKTDLGMLRDKVKLALDMDFQVQVTFILGLPGETPETVQQTFDYAHSLGTYAGIHILAPMPGSEVCERAEAYGMKILHRDWGRYDANHVVSETDGISAAELETIAAENDRNFARMAKMEEQQWRGGRLAGRALEDMEKRRNMAFFFGLMKNGFFESDDNSVERAGDPETVQGIAEKAAASAGIDASEAGMWISRAVDSGDLRIVTSGASAKLAFADDDRFKF